MKSFSYFIAAVFTILTVPPGILAEEPAILVQANTEEALFIRRILEFWKEQDYRLVRSQIRQFFLTYPHSTYMESLRIILADTYWNEKKYTEALSIYETLSDAKLKHKTLGKKLDCLLNLNQLRTIIYELDFYFSNGLSSSLEEAWIYCYAESAAFLANSEPDEASFFLERAKRGYEKLLTGSRHLQAKIGLAKVHESLHEYSLAADYYLQASVDVKEEKKEELLFHAGRMQLCFNSDQALNTLKVLQQEGGRLAKEAALIRLRLLASQDKYVEIVQEEQGFAALLQNEYKQLFQWLLGKSHACLHHYVEAISYLSPLVFQDLEEQEFQFQEFNGKVALSLLIKAYHQLGQMEPLEACLLAFYKKKPEKLSQEQKQWLAIHLYKKVTLENKLELGEVCLSLLQEQMSLNTHQDEVIKQEGELKLLTLYSTLGKQKEEKQLLELMAAQTDTQPKLKECVFMKLAKAMERDGELQSALDLYQQILTLKEINAENKVIAKLQTARLSYLLLPEKERTLTHPKIEEVLSTLKDLQIHKVMKEEPSHLEAAIDYAAIRASVEPLNNQLALQLTLLESARREFSSCSDIYSKSYYDSFALDPNKKALYQAYLLLMDAKIAELKSKVLGLNEGKDQAELAQNIYAQLLNLPVGVTDYILNQLKPHDVSYFPVLGFFSAQIRDE